MFKTILVPLDGSKRAEKILPYVEDLACARECRIVLVEVIEPDTFVAASSDAMPYYSQELVESVFTGARAYLTTVADECRAKGLVATTLVTEGPTVRTILEVAEREGADLIAMASHGRTGLARVFYGSVAAGILQQADRPLLLVRSTESQSAD